MIKGIFLFLILNRLFSALVGGDYRKGVIGYDYIYEVSPYGIVVINIKDQTNPYIEEEIPTMGTAIDAAILGDYLYILDDEEGIIVYSIDKKQIENRYAFKNGSVLLSIPPHIYLGTLDGEIFVFIQKEKGELDLINKLKFASLPVTSLDIAEKGLFVLFSDSLLTYFVFEKDKKVKEIKRIDFGEKIKSFKVIDTFIVYGAEDGGLYLNSFNNFSHKLRRLLIPETIFTDISIYGSKIFFGSDDGKIFVFSYPEFNKEGDTHLVGEVNDIIPIGDLLYVSLGKGGISVLRIPDLEEIKTIGNTGIFLSIDKINDRLVYVIDRTVGVRFFSFFSPTEPFKDYECEIPGKVIKVIKYKEYFLIGIEEGGIYIISSKSPSDIRGFLPTDGKLKDILIIKDRLFVSHENGINVYKLEDKITPVFEKKYKSFFSYLLSFEENKFINFSEKGITIYDIDGKIIKHEEKIFPIALSQKEGGIYILNINGEIYKYKNSLEYIGKVKLPVINFDIFQNKIYAVGGDSIIRVYSLPKLNLEKEYKIEEKLYGIKVESPYIFAHGNNKIFIYNMGENKLDLINTIITDFPISSINLYPTGIAVYGLNKLEFYNFFNFKNPYEISCYLLLEGIWGSNFYKNLPTLFVAAGSQGLIGIDFSNPSSPKEIFKYTSPNSFTYDVAISGRYVFTAELEGGIRIFEILDGKKIKFIKSINEKAYSINVIENTFLIAGDDEGNLRLYELVGGGFNKICDTKIIDAPIRDIEIFKKYLYIAAGKEGIVCVDIQHSRIPRIVKIEKTDYPVERLKIIGNRLFSFFGRYGFEVYSLKRNGEIGEKIYFIDTPGSAQDICEVGDYYIIADTYSLEVMKK